MDIQNTGNAPGVEIVNCIKEAGLTPDMTDLAQLAGAVKILGGLSREEIQEMINEAVRTVSPYRLCEYYYFRSPALRPGFQPAQGALLENAATLYPEAWAYLRTAEGQALCKTEAEWQAMTHATWATLADGTQIGWDGVGGAPFYAPNLETGALRLPDLRGMYAEAAGFDSLGVGAVHGDQLQKHRHNFRLNGSEGLGMAYGVYTGGAQIYAPVNGFTATDGVAQAFYVGGIASVNGVSMGNSTKPRAYGVLPCVYLGQPAS